MDRPVKAADRIAELRRQLRVDENSLLDKYAGRIDAIERARPWFVGCAGFGAALTGVGRFFVGTPGIIVTAVGIAIALIFGGLVGWTDFRKLELSREARSAMNVADEALASAAQFASDLDDETRHRLLRDDRLEAAALMRDAIALAVAGGLETADALDMVLDGAKLRVVAACGFEAAEYWAITVFSPNQTGDEMAKIAALWNDATTSAQVSRPWRKGEGFTGVAWRNERPVIVPDMTIAGLADSYPVPDNKYRDHDRLRYRSAASYPVVVDGKVWGVVTATSDRPNRFDLSTPDGTEALRTIQDVASHVALLATIERYKRRGSYNG